MREVRGHETGKGGEEEKRENESDATYGQGRKGL
jgi:hypothetical protein